MYLIRIFTIFLAFSLASLISPDAFAFMGSLHDETQETANDKTKNETNNGANIFNALVPYEQTSFMAKSTDGDDNSIEINISIRYFFRATDDADKKPSYNQFRPFFSYTSKSDFYWFPPSRDTRFSAPVISRLQNPAFHLLYEKASSEGSLWDWFDIGAEHISNGQATDASQNKQAAIQAYNSNDRAFMDSISRVDATLALTVEANKQFNDTLHNDLKLKIYPIRWGQEAGVYWGPYANQNLDFRDFQLIRLQWGIDLFCKNCRFNAEMTMGSRGVSTDSWNFQMLLPFKIPNTEYTVPLTFSSHRGPMNNMSNYTESQNNYAAGLLLSF